MHRRLLFLAIALGPGLTLGCDALLGYNDLSPRGESDGGVVTGGPDATMGNVPAGDSGTAAPDGSPNVQDANASDAGAGDQTTDAHEAGGDATTGSDASLDATGTLDSSANIDSSPFLVVDASDAALCALPFGAAPCSSVPPFTGHQVIDGLDDDFCGVPGVNFLYTSGFTVGANAGPGPITLDGGSDDSAIIRVGWSSDALHVFVHVVDSDWVPPPDGGCVANCSAVEVYVAATSMLSGPYNGTNNGGAIQILLTAPPTSAVAFYNSGPGAYQPDPVDPSQYIGIVTGDGYSIELEYRWPLTHPAPIASGLGIGLDFAFDVEDGEDASPDGRQWQSIFGYTPLLEDAGETPSPACGTNYPEPWCDDRTWCTPTLQ